MRSTLLASCLLLSFAVVGCEDPAKTAAKPENAPASPAGPTDAGKGKMEGPGGSMAPATPDPAPAPATTEPKKEETPK